MFPVRFNSAAAGVLAFLISSTSFAASVTITGGVDTPISVTADAHTTRFFREQPDDDGRLIVRAEGPAVLALHYRAIGGGIAHGMFRILRDGGPFSDNAYKLPADSTAKAADASGGDVAVSAEGVLHVQVAEGVHRYEVSVLKGPPLIVVVYKASEFDSSVAAAPEKNLFAVEPGYHEPPPPHPDAKELTFVQATPAPKAKPADSPVMRLVEGETPKELRSGMSIALRGGVLLPIQQQTNTNAATGVAIAGRRLTYPADLEVAWDITRVWSLFLDATYAELTSSQHIPPPEFSAFNAVNQTSFTRALPISLGFSALGPCCAAVGVRFRLGATAAWLDEHATLTSSGVAAVPAHNPAIGVGGIGALSLDIAAGPGYVSIEARYFIVWALSAPSTSIGGQSVATGPAIIDAAMALAGYRLEF